MTYFLEYILDNMMITGQVENWVLIYDMHGLNVATVPYGVDWFNKIFKDLFSFIQNNYRARLYRGYVLNAPWTFSVVWKAVKLIIEETTSMKITITSSNTEPRLKEHVNPEQLEVKYGGEMPDLTEFWPPKPNTADIFVAGDVPSKILSV